MHFRAIIAVLLTVYAVQHTLADSPIWVTKLLTRVPRTEAEVAAAHGASSDECVRLPPGTRLSVEEDWRPLTYDVTLAEAPSAAPITRPYYVNRRPVLTFGLEMTAADRARLPFFSSSIIASHVDGTYVNVQVRLHRAANGGEPYLHYRPLALVGNYNNAEESGDYQDMLEASVRNLRSLGLWVKPGSPLSASALRTLVAVNRCTISKPDPTTGAAQILPYYDLFFVRARVEGDRVTLHSFASKDYLAKLCYLPPYQTPTDAKSCTFASTIYFTDWAYAAQVPTAQAARSARYNSREEFLVTELDAFVAKEGLSGTAYDNLNDVLDAIIDGRVRANEVR